MTILTKTVQSITAILKILMNYCVIIFALYLHISKYYIVAYMNMSYLLSLILFIITCIQLGKTAFDT